MKDLFILRGIPGCGKSTVAEAICGTGTICCADDWFYETYGEYKWSREDIGKAHEWCRNKADTAMKAGISKVVIANTNTRAEEYKPYVEMAKENGYTIHFLVVENRHEGKDSHGVPEESLKKMEQRIKSNIKLR